MILCRFYSPMVDRWPAGHVVLCKATQNIPILLQHVHGARRLPNHPGQNLATHAKRQARPAKPARRYYPLGPPPLRTYRRYAATTTSLPYKTKTGSAFALPVPSIHFLYMRNLAVWTRLELATSAVTGRHSNQTELPDLTPTQRALSPVVRHKGTAISRTCKHPLQYFLSVRP